MLGSKFQTVGESGTTKGQPVPGLPPRREGVSFGAPTQPGRAAFCLYASAVLDVPASRLGGGHGAGMSEALRRGVPVTANPTNPRRTGLPPMHQVPGDRESGRRTRFFFARFGHRYWPRVFEDALYNQRDETGTGLTKSGLCPTLTTRSVVPYPVRHTGILSAGRTAFRGRSSYRHDCKGRRMGKTASQLIQVHVELTPRGNGGGTPEIDGRPWNTRLAPLCRRADPEGVANWLRWCKRQMKYGVSVDTLEDWIGGFVSLRDRGALKWIDKGQAFKPAAIERLPIGERDQLRKAVR